MGTIQTPRTRKQLRCPIIGAPKKLTVDDVMLPTYYDVMKYYIWVKHHLKPTECSKDPIVTEILEQIAATVEHLWHKASDPIVSHTRVLQVILTYHNKYMKQIKPFNGRKGEVNYQRKLQKFRDESKTKLFEIAACKCTKSLCKCDKTRKVPTEERTFLLYQRITRNIAIGGIDRTVTERKSKRMIRQLKEAASRAKEVVRDAETADTDSAETRQNINFSFDSEQSSAESDVDDRDDVAPTTPSTSTVEDRITSDM